MKKYKVYKGTEFLAEFDQVIPLYSFLKERIKDPTHFNSMVLTRELTRPGDILFKSKEDDKYIIVKVPEEKE